MNEFGIHGFFLGLIIWFCLFRQSNEILQISIVISCAENVQFNEIGIFLMKCVLFWLEIMGISLCFFSTIEENVFLILHDILFYDHNSMHYVHMDDRPPIEKLPVTKKLLDKAVTSHIKHKNYAARQKSKLQKAVAKVGK